MARGGAVLGLLVMALFTGCVVSRPVATAPAQRSVAYPHGQWILYGDGTTRAPYEWVWVPTGAPAPPMR
jgi:hypothetical protein